MARLDVCVLNAGIGERGDVFDRSSSASWQKVLDVDLTAVIENCRQAVQCMGSVGSGGTIVLVASAGGCMLSMHVGIRNCRMCRSRFRSLSGFCSASRLARHAQQSGLW